MLGQTISIKELEWRIHLPHTGSSLGPFISDDKDVTPRNSLFPNRRDQLLFGVEYDGRAFHL